MTAEIITTAENITTPLAVAAIIVAGGQGIRASNTGGPKQFAALAGRPVLYWSVAAFAQHDAVTMVHIVVPEGYMAQAQSAIVPHEAGISIGGATRQASVARGLAAVSELPDHAIVLVHDAARPSVSADIISRCIAAFDDPDIAGVVPVLPVVDTLAQSHDGHLQDIVDRSVIFRVQTPQAFRLGWLRRAHAAAAGTDASDDAQMVRTIGGRVITVAGAVALNKLTYKEDFAMAEAMLATTIVPNAPPNAPQFRTIVGMGYDVHRLETGTDLWLGGVQIAHDKGLAGHSDADVALHAITDAILGAIGAGDIGTHFPPSEPQWKGARSDRFLAHAAQLVAAAGGSIDHVDLTIIAEAPKIGPHRAAMRTAIATILQIAENHVSIKATTTERLGFTGREEGIAAQAVATVALPRAGKAK